MRVVIAEDQVLLREGLVRLFEDAGHAVVRTQGDAEGMVEIVSQVRPDLVVLDIRMPPDFSDEGARAAVALKDADPTTAVLMLSQHIETRHVARLVRMAGFGYLLKDRVLDVAEFLAAAERVSRGGSALDPEVVGSLVSARDSAGPLAALSDREREVLHLMAQGFTNTGIADRLVLSERTVEAHVRHLMAKLDLPEDVDGHRRVLAVLRYLSAEGGPAGRIAPG
jgi:DNA-binding NarL/FixJ family response regulator